MWLYIYVSHFADWEMIAYTANTLIFVLSGTVIAEPDILHMIGLPFYALRILAVVEGSGCCSSVPWAQIFWLWIELERGNYPDSIGSTWSGCLISVSVLVKLASSFKVAKWLVRNNGLAELGKRRDRPQKNGPGWNV
ncbi:unnamed protein product [Calypogeia fissa]